MLISIHVSMYLEMHNLIQKIIPNLTKLCESIFLNNWKQSKAVTYVLKRPRILEKIIYIHRNLQLVNVMLLESKLCHT